MISKNNQIFIIDYNGNKKTLFVNENQTIKELKENLQQNEENNFSLFFEGELLSESKSLVELNISSGSTFQMVKGLIGGVVFTLEGGVKKYGSAKLPYAGGEGYTVIYNATWTQKEHKDTKKKSDYSQNLEPSDHRK